MWIGLAFKIYYLLFGCYTLIPYTTFFCCQFSIYITVFLAFLIDADSSLVVSWGESYKELEDRDSPTEDGEVDAPSRKVAEIDRDVIENNVNDKDNKLASS